MSDINKSEEVDGTEEVNSNDNSAQLNDNQNTEDTSSDVDVIDESTEPDQGIEEENVENAPSDAAETTDEATATDKTINNEKIVDSATAEEHDKVLNEIEESNAEDAEDEGNKDRHTIEVKAYDTMSLEALVIELEKLLKNEKVQAIKSHIDDINSEFKTKLQALVDEKKEDFINEGGNEIDFHYSSPVQKRYKEAYRQYRKKVNEHYQGLEKNLKQNLVDKLEIIEELKGLINVEENINTTYKHFKELQEQWRNTGPIPRDKYNNAWNSYHHHVERFYDFLHINRDLRDLDFKHNLEKKLLIIERAEELAKDDDIMRAFRELQELHKMWKEELGPVGREHREAIWERFKVATKTINDKRQVYYKEIDKVYEKNLEHKLEIILKIEQIAIQENSSHGALQNKIKEVEVLRDAFFNAGKVPIKVNEATWAKFKESVRLFNRKKNVFYKDLKKDQYKNLQLKLDLIKIAEDNKESDDFESVTPLMKKIQGDWKKIGHVPRKDSDKIWKRFKAACNQYFDRIHAKRNAASEEQVEAYNKKNELLKSLKDLKLPEDKKEGVETIKDQIKQWQNLGRVPSDKRYIDGKFQKMIDGLLTDLKVDKTEAEMIKYENKLDSLSTSDDSRNLDNEHSFIRKKIDEVKGQINQLENNLQFFTNVGEDNPLVKEVHGNIKNHKEALDLWKAKLQKIKKLY